MKMHELTQQSRATKKRVGRGISAGGGKTAGRGTKGQNSRTGGGVKLGFEGGQTKLSRRLPKKRGFNANPKLVFEIVNISDLTKLKKAVINSEVLAEAGIVKGKQSTIKLLSMGDVSTKLTVSVAAASKQAVKKIEAAGGSVQLTDSKPTVSAKSDLSDKPSKS